ncbi:MAG: 2-C-methyl-D-erythritol 2,4-cyclodiphosphate synthase [Clostridia bacterium]|nr:2-C-methyl-D-erythritol 2,4-cyclodiphosphate synthase [Clostridia bacterium]
MKFRIGEGYDVHRLVAGRKCIIGGVEIPFEKGLLGHSDADVLLHAVTDALLGAAGMGDIGRRYPDTDPHWQGADSLALLQDTAKDLRRSGFVPVNVDCTVICQMPKITPHASQMCKNIAAALGIDEACVNVKGKTEEGLGFTGEGLGIAARAVALVEQA